MVSNQNKQNVSDEFALLYYQHQYNRFNKIESGNMTLTNIVITISIGAFIFGFKDLQLTLINGVMLPFLVVLVNLFAIGYTKRGYIHMEIHRDRAHHILRCFAQQLYDYDKSSQAPRPFRKGRTWIQTLLNSLFIFVALIPIIIYLYGLLN